MLGKLGSWKVRIIGNVYYDIGEAKLIFPYEDDPFRTANVDTDGGNQYEQEDAQTTGDSQSYLDLLPLVLLIVSGADVLLPVLSEAPLCIFCSAFAELSVAPGSCGSATVSSLCSTTVLTALRQKL